MPMIPVDNIADLQPGDIIRGRISGDAFVVTANYGQRVTAVRTVDVTNPNEWTVLRRTDRDGH